MFAEKFSPLTHKYPKEADALIRLASYFEDIETRYGSKLNRIKLDPQRLFSISEAGSTSRLSNIIGQLISEKIIKRKIIVKPGGGSGLEFDSMAELPLVLRDPDRDVDVVVTTEMVSTIYIPIIE